MTLEFRIEEETIKEGFFKKGLKFFKGFFGLSNENMYSVADELVHCIKNGIKTIIIPLRLNYVKTNIGHANVLIYRNKDLIDENEDVIEHFEPNGKMDEQHIIDKKLDDFIDILKNKLVERGLPKVNLKHASDVCPVRGLQRVESSIPHAIINENGVSETEGYCAVWALLFIELALKYPKYNSYILVRSIFNVSQNICKRDSNVVIRNIENPFYLRDLMRGYVKKISEKLKKYYSPFFDDKFNIFKSSSDHHSNIFDIEKIINTSEYDGNLLNCYTLAFTKVEYIRLNNIDKDKYIAGLNNEIKKLEKNQNNEDKIHCIEFEKSIIEKMDLLENIGNSVSKSISRSRNENYQSQVIEPTSITANSSRKSPKSTTIKSRSHQSQVVEPRSISANSRKSVKSIKETNSDQIYGHKKTYKRKKGRSYGFRGRKRL
jgi:hypothetical protein